MYRARRPTLRECATPHAPDDALGPSPSFLTAGESILRARLALAFASHCRLSATNAEREARRRRQRHPLRLARPLTPSMGSTISPQARASAELAEFRAGTKQCREAVAVLQDAFRARGPCSSPSASHEKLGPYVAALQLCPWIQHPVGPARCWSQRRRLHALCSRRCGGWILRRCARSRCAAGASARFPLLLSSTVAL